MLKIRLFKLLTQMLFNAVEQIHIVNLLKVNVVQLQGTYCLRSVCTAKYILNKIIIKLWRHRYGVLF